MEFQLSQDMVDQFVDLTGDFSSLHRDELFATRSMYRTNVVHGMLPLLFISALPVCSPDNATCFFNKISARFLKPVYVNDQLLLQSEVLEILPEQNTITFEFTIRKDQTQTIVTTGRFTLTYKESLINNEFHLLPDTNNAGKCLILDHLEEKEKLLEQISKGDQENFRFLVSPQHALALYKIIQKRIGAPHLSDASHWQTRCDTSNLLSTSLFSTFAGLVMPGKYASFLNFDVTFNKNIQWNTRYTFSGTVKFKSPLTSILVENISICETENRMTSNASGKIQVKVNDLSYQMPSIEFLRENEMDLKLKDKVVLITGASRGIGETTAKLFSLHGSKVIVNYNKNKESAQKVVDEIISGGGEACAIQADVSDHWQVKEMVSSAYGKYGMIHILINNAHHDARPGPFLELTWDDFQKDVDVTIKGAVHCCQEVLPLMIKHKFGKIINISTIAVDNPLPGNTKYVTAKSALVGLTRSLAVEYAPYNITVNIVEPGFVETDLTQYVPKMFLQDIKNSNPMQRNASPGDVAKAIVTMASSLASYTTGQKFIVSGGVPPFL